MTDGIDRNSRKPGEHAALQQGILELESGLKKDTRFTILEITGLAVAVVLLFVLQGGFGDHPVATVVVGALVSLIGISRANGMIRHSDTKIVLQRQLQIVAKHRVKADKLYDLSILDPLTSLHNRRFGELRLKEEIARAERSGEPLAVVLFDLDYFKEINDKFGHAAGDAALREFSRRLKRAIRACDIPVRLGGDEFLVILPECPRDKVNVIIERTGTPQIEFNGEKIHVCYSVGVAQYQYSDTSEAMLARADQVLYVKKQARPGANTVASIAKHAASLDPDSGVTPLPLETRDLTVRTRQQHGAEVDWERP
ncbi:MAG TPA: GGDEF domain-containing protein [Candidatus Acidoferrum sp.]|jgi:diguanylate cyclase (GGDEF)-like protein